MSGRELLDLAVFLDRSLNVLLSAVAFVVVVRLARRWGFRTMDPAERFQISGYMILILSAGYAAVESIIQDVDPGLRIIFSTIALTYVIVGGFMRLRSPKPPVPPRYNG